MKLIRLNLPAWVVSVRLLLSACVCALLLFSQASPAYSRPASDPTGGEANLTKIEKEAQKAVLEDPYSREKTQKKANEGLNEIQGSADIDKMKRPENSKGAESIEQKVQKALEKAEGKVQGTVESGKDLVRNPKQGEFSKELARSSKSSPKGGEANLTGIEKEAQKAVLEDPYSLEKTKAKANEGLNEIQGSADIDKMKRPENSQGGKSIEQKIQKALEKAEGKK